jgi:hypothetical protein
MWPEWRKEGTYKNFGAACCKTFAWNDNMKMEAGSQGDSCGNRR